MTVDLSSNANYYASFSGMQLAAKPVGRGQLEGTLYALAIYCLRTQHRRIGRMNERRLIELFMKQRPGLVSPADPYFMRVRRKPFKAWLLRNLNRIAMTKGDLRAERFEELDREILDYAENGPHFHNPAHRQAWEAARAH